MQHIHFLRHTVVCGIAVLCALSCGPKKEVQQAPPSYKVVTVDTTSATVYTFYPTVMQSNQVVEIRSKASGFIESIDALEGSLVRKGQLIMRIEDDTYQEALKAANSSVKIAQAQLYNAKLEVQKLTPLVEKGIMSDYALETAISNQEAAEASLEQAQAKYNNAVLDLDYTRITSPVDGILGRIPLRVGSYVGALSTDPLTTVAGKGDVVAYFSLDEAELLRLLEIYRTYPKIREHMYAPNVDLILSDETIYEHKGAMENASGLIDQNTGSISVKVVFPNPEGRIISGSSAKLRFPAEHHGAVVIPQQATFEIQDKVMVYTVDAKGVVTAKAVTIAGITGTSYVVTDGLQKGDRIVVEGVNRLKDNMVITPQE